MQLHDEMSLASEALRLKPNLRMSQILPPDRTGLLLKYLRFAWRAVRHDGCLTTLGNFLSELTFDLRYGTRTWLPKDLALLATTGGSLTDGVQYQGTNPRLARKLLRSLPTYAKNGYFIDYGCGKGRGLLLGIEAGFTRLIGVEFAPELASQCRANLKGARGLPAISSISVVEGDAAEFHPPPGPLVAFFYNPFRGETLRRVIQKLTLHAQTPGQAVQIVYINPQELEQFTQQGWVTQNQIVSKGMLLGVVLGRNP